MERADNSEAAATGYKWREYVIFATSDRFEWPDKGPAVKCVSLKTM